jgi:hypothetical protein
MSILSGELAETIGDALIDADIPFDIVITRTFYTEGPNPWEPGEEVSTAYPCRGWVENYSDDAVSGTLIDARDVRVMVLTTSISIVPTDVTDRVAIGGRTFTIINVKHDASGALYVIQARA